MSARSRGKRPLLRCGACRAPIALLRTAAGCDCTVTVCSCEGCRRCLRLWVDERCEACVLRAVAAVLLGERPANDC